jgi:hypothetical protein
MCDRCSTVMERSELGVGYRASIICILKWSNPVHKYAESIGLLNQTKTVTIVAK